MAQTKAQVAIKNLNKIASEWEGPEWEVGEGLNKDLKYGALKKLKHLAQTLGKVKIRYSNLVEAFRNRIQTLHADVSDELYVSDKAKDTAQAEYGNDEFAKQKHFKNQYKTVKDKVDKLPFENIEGANMDDLDKKINMADAALLKAREEASNVLVAGIKDAKENLLIKARRKQNFVKKNNLGLPQDFWQISYENDSVKELKKKVEKYENDANNAHIKKLDVVVGYKELLKTDKKDYVKTFNQNIYDAWYSKLTEKNQHYFIFKWIMNQATIIENLTETDLNAAITRLEEVKLEKQRLETEFVQHKHEEQEAVVLTLLPESGFHDVDDFHKASAAVTIQNLQKASAEVTRERRHSITQYKPITPGAREWMNTHLLKKKPEGLLERNPRLSKIYL